MPRALTEQEKCRLCERLLEKGKAVVLSLGLKKVSVDDITKAAGMAKGSFYQHFESKEQFLYELIQSMHQQVFTQAEQMVRKEKDLQTNIRNLLVNMFHIPELVFFTKNYDDINTLFDSMSKQEIQTSKELEGDMFKELLILAEVDTQSVKPGVVHNYLLTMHLMMASDLMLEDDLPETFERMIDGLSSYILGGVK